MWGKKESKAPDHSGRRVICRWADEEEGGVEVQAFESGLGTNLCVGFASQVTTVMSGLVFDIDIGENFTLLLMNTFMIVHHRSTIKVIIVLHHVFKESLEWMIQTT